MCSSDLLQLLEAMSKIDYKPPQHYHLYPAPGPMAKSPYAANALAGTVFEQHPPFTNNKVAAQFVKEFNSRATKAGLPDNSVEVQAAVSFTAWQLLEAGVNGAKSLDDKQIAAYLKKSVVDTIYGPTKFDGKYNHGEPAQLIRQVQNKEWKVVWPKQFAAPGIKLIPT